MADIDLSKAIEAATEAVHSDNCPDDECEGGDQGEYRRQAETIIEAALPHIRAALAEQVEAPISPEQTENRYRWGMDDGLRKAARIIRGAAS